MYKRKLLEEQVFAIQKELLWKILPYKEVGLIKGEINTVKSIIENGLFRKRYELEENPSFKQLIPYAIISNKGSYYLLRRTEGQTEKRLHNKLHLGVGGHMNPDESNKPDLQYLINELKREFSEEVELLNNCVIKEIEFIGFINDESISVGLFHMGLLFSIQVSDKNVVVNETDKMRGEWIDKSELAYYYDEMETWSRIAIDNYLL